ncbi:Methyltransferase domain-containing protein [Amycolatopsis marina]|uniref:Methyltransferase domain-containing protein n=1 Tax=Amycolatopsis marina TaxID=490629 RepID=A0A1I0Z898_9PSEU|nr:class I SAM-dependent methyltransferase [Amycolatopsis marina]SFB20800.1 Methyltransferase domain-containing protein [Amycolatopsis marina]
MSENSVDERFTKPYWDERYGSATRMWSGNPNPQLVREVADLEPGTALEAGCGEGADAHWLARQGWRVTAMDVSSVAIERGAAHAEPEIADRITWRQADLTSWTAEDTYDLVSAQFIHFPQPLRERVYTQLAAAVAPGGTLLVVAHHPHDMHTAKDHRPQEPDLFFTAEELAESLDPKEWEIVTTDARPRVATTPDGNEISIRDTVLRARRRS